MAGRDPRLDDGLSSAQSLARDSGASTTTRVSSVLAGVSFGLLFHVYPYFWTAAAAALVMAFILDRGHRRLYVEIALIGGLIGSYRLFWDWMLKQSTVPDWLIRSDKFVQVSRFENLKPPIVASLIVLMGFIWVWRHRRDAIYLWSMSLSGLVLFKNHLVTGRDIENYHWLYVWGPCCSLLLLLMIVSILPSQGARARIAFLAVMTLALADLAIGMACESQSR